MRESYDAERRELREREREGGALVQPAALYVELCQAREGGESVGECCARAGEGPVRCGGGTMQSVFKGISLGHKWLVVEHEVAEGGVEGQRGEGCVRVKQRRGDGDVERCQSADRRECARDCAGVCGRSVPSGLQAPALSRRCEAGPLTSSWRGVVAPERTARTARSMSL